MSQEDPPKPKPSLGAQNVPSGTMRLGAVTAAEALVPSVGQEPAASPPPEGRGSHRTATMARIDPGVLKGAVGGALLGSRHGAPSSPMGETVSPGVSGRDEGATVRLDAEEIRKLYGDAAVEGERPSPLPRLAPEEVSAPAPSPAPAKPTQVSRELRLEEDPNAPAVQDAGPVIGPPPSDTGYMALELIVGAEKAARVPYAKRAIFPLVVFLLLVIVLITCLHLFLPHS